MRRGWALIGMALVTGACFAIPQSWGRDEHAKDGHAGKAGHQDADKGKHAKHEPKPTDEVTDQPHWHFFDNRAFTVVIPLAWLDIKTPWGTFHFPTKYMVVELIAAVLVAWLLINLAKRMQSGDPVHGTLWNALEALVLFVRDEIARPNLTAEDHGHDHHDEHGHGHGQASAPKSPYAEADRFVPFLCTIFLFILACNLLGLIPFMGSPTGNIFVTGALALCSFAVLHGAAIAKMGVFHYLASLWPQIDVPPMFGFGWLLGKAIQVMIFVIELFGTVIKCGVLAVRLFANMFAGHTVVASILFFIFAARNHDLWGLITAASVAGVVALSLLELFVAFLQAFIFTFLTALFTGMAVNPQH